MTIVKWLDIKFTEEEIDSIKYALSFGDISGFSPVVSEFESRCAEAVGSKHAIACCNGTAALIVSLLALKKHLGKEITIAVPTWTYIAPANAADYVGNLVLIDSDINSHNMAAKIPEKVDVLCPVDMAGVPADYDEFKKYNLPIVADAAESLGSSYKGRSVGTLADLTTMSFQSSKIIITGEGGMIFTDNDDLQSICKLIINQGYGPKGYAEHSHIAKGYNFRMSALEAAVGLVQIKKLNKNLEKRKTIAQIYNTIDHPIIKKHKIPINTSPNYYSYLIMLDNKNRRDNLKEYLKANGIITKLWSPVHFHEPYKDKNIGFPNADYIFDHHLRLPIHNEMTPEMAQYVVDCINRYISN